MDKEDTKQTALPEVQRQEIEDVVADAVADAVEEYAKTVCARLDELHPKVDALMENLREVTNERDEARKFLRSVLIAARPVLDTFDAEGYVSMDDMSELGYWAAEAAKNVLHEEWS